jgi:hypothetical protein
MSLHIVDRIPTKVRQTSNGKWCIKQPSLTNCARATVTCEHISESQSVLHPYNFARCNSSSEYDLDLTLSTSVRVIRRSS